MKRRCRSNSTTRLMTRLALMALLVGASLPGCEREDSAGAQTMTSQALIERYSNLLLEGVEEDGIFIKAARLDPSTGEMLQVLIKTDDGLITAGRACLVVHAYDDTFALKLMDVRVARSSSETSRLVRFETLTTKPVPAGVKIRDSILTIPTGELLSGVGSE